LHLTWNRAWIRTLRLSRLALTLPLLLTWHRNGIFLPLHRGLTLTLRVSLARLSLKRSRILLSLRERLTWCLTLSLRLPLPLPLALIRLTRILTLRLRLRILRRKSLRFTLRLHTGNGFDWNFLLALRQEIGFGRRIGFTPCSSLGPAVRAPGMKAKNDEVA
jgi:hypothetical protein